MRAPERIETDRLLIRRPVARDAKAIFARYAADEDVTKFLSFPRHRSLDDTRAFITFSDNEWDRWPAGPYVVLDRRTGQLLGGTGLAFERDDCAATGYVLAKDAWGRGYATETLAAMVHVARDAGVRRLYAICHVDHAASARVLEKNGFVREGVLTAHTEFPNLSRGERLDVLAYGLVFGRADR